MHFSITFLVTLLSAVEARRHSLRSHHVIKPSLARRQATTMTASNIPDGAVSTGCTQYYNVQAGQYCYIVADLFQITIESFYTMNPELDSKCSNLWAGYDYCVSQSAATESTPPATDSAASVSSVSLVSHNSAVASSLADSSLTTTPVIRSPIATPTSTLTYSSSSSSYSAPPSPPTSTYTPPAPSPSPTTSAAVVAASPAPLSIGNLLSEAGVTSFLGTNTNAIVSWFRTDNSGDDTNGHSWCGLGKGTGYSDNDAGFAPDVTTMLANFGGDYVAAGVAYCGLEAEFTTPDGRTAILYVADGFDSKWVRTPSSVDVIIGSFPLLFGSTTSNKNDVVQGASWKFTGKRNPDYAFKGYGH